MTNDEAKGAKAQQQPRQGAVASEQNERAPKPLPNAISSSISGPGIGDDVAMKRAHLMEDAANATPQAGRRPSPEPYDPWPVRKMYIKGILSGAAVIVIVLIFLIVAGSMNPVA